MDVLSQDQIDPISLIRHVRAEFGESRKSELPRIHRASERRQIGCAGTKILGAIPPAEHFIDIGVFECLLCILDALGIETYRFLDVLSGYAIAPSWPVLYERIFTLLVTSVLSDPKRLSPISIRYARWSVARRTNAPSPYRVKAA
jgi:hypothetical protein